MMLHASVARKFFVRCGLVIRELIPEYAGSGSSIHGNLLDGDIT
ncbi:hypothetical protein L842_0199 [Mycobacterium intracellulare MIN_052511_1280]|nr:hypothetical protein L842_0199 [Mycobacterium intracellulare MIN_052511_1280]